MTLSFGLKEKTKTSCRVWLFVGSRIVEICSTRHLLLHRQWSHLFSDKRFYTFPGDVRQFLAQLLHGKNSNFPCEKRNFKFWSFSFDKLHPPSMQASSPSAYGNLVPHFYPHVYRSGLQPSCMARKVHRLAHALMKCFTLSWNVLAVLTKSGGACVETGTSVPLDPYHSFDILTGPSCWPSSPQYATLLQIHAFALTQVNILHAYILTRDSKRATIGFSNKHPGNTSVWDSSKQESVGLVLHRRGQLQLQRHVNAELMSTLLYH